jgi:hypothetical protein
MDGREFYSSLIRLHILHHAVQEPIFGLGIIEELARHGYKLSAGRNSVLFMPFTLVASGER